MTPPFVAPAQLPPPGIEGLDPTWSRLVTVPTTDGSGRTWHLLDNGVADPRLTLLCVHGNPSWSFLWRRIVAAAPDDVRVIAVDQLDMGYSERTGRVRRLSTRIDDLCALTAELGLNGPVVTIAHDWGGPVSLGWAARNHGRLAGVVLLNTAVHQPAGSPAPTLIRAVRSKGVLRRVTVDTSAFIRGAMEMSRPRLSPGVRSGFLAPYASSERRAAIADFVADIPLDADHPSAATLEDVATSLDGLSDTPVLLLWGPHDRVFSDLYLHDLEARLPHADVHRFVGASHFVSEDADVVTPILDWLPAAGPAASGPAPTGAAPAHHIVAEREPVWAGLLDGTVADEVAVVEMAGSRSSIRFGDLAERIRHAAAGLAESGVAAGDQVAIMIPPGIDLHIALHACWLIGAVAVVVDAGLGPKGMSRALESAAPDHLIGVPRALIASRILRWPGRRLSVEPLAPALQRALGVAGDLHSLAAGDAAIPPPPSSADMAAVVFTSGSTGPSKGVAYRHGQIQAQRDALTRLYDIGPGDRLVAAFALFALYGPAMGITTVVPDMDVTAPGTLTAGALGEAAVTVDATLVFASPAALANVVRTAHELTSEHRSAFAGVRLLMSAGAPVSRSLLQAAADLFPEAEAHTPYGMTEVLPVADISLTGIAAAAPNRPDGAGVCVGHPVDGVEVAIAALDGQGDATGLPTADPGVGGEIIVRADHARDRYVRLWHTGFLAAQPPGWHRTGDVGVLDDDGRLWVGGRLGHVITTAHGPLTPVAIEQAVEGLGDVDLAAAVGVGPTGTQQLVVVVETAESGRRPALAELELLDRVRSVVGHDVAAVLTVPELPVDRRHNSKIDRSAVAAWASGVLAGGRLGRL